MKSENYQTVLSFKSYNLKYPLYVIATKVIKAACCRQYVVVETGEGKKTSKCLLQKIYRPFSKDFSCRVRRYLGGSGPDKTITSSTWTKYLLRHQTLNVWLFLKIDQ
jgi:hypothetical protein